MNKTPESLIIDTVQVGVGVLVGGAAGAAIGTIILPGAGTALGYLIGASGGISVLKKIELGRC
ncbi:hypothetical protein OM416_27775 [Paenibacillus sp. LS1]|uniref:hypothetical protein n=1 Tax=Paenibacillus sp. LS1 TaxID=2992120 RepID=UPI0022321C66|nr:hypothetical protein [Paenibacillus sp. LS1]MCW3795412.1 hypothetical protein [Paenibacillus sp. LS1]